MIKTQEINIRRREKGHVAVRGLVGVSGLLLVIIALMLLLSLQSLSTNTAAADLGLSWPSFGGASSDTTSSWSQEEQEALLTLFTLQQTQLQQLSPGPTILTAEGEPLEGEISGQYINAKIKISFLGAGNCKSEINGQLQLPDVDPLDFEGEHTGSCNIVEHLRAISKVVSDTIEGAFDRLSIDVAAKLIEKGISLKTLWRVFGDFQLALLQLLLQRVDPEIHSAWIEELMRIISSTQFQP